MKERRAGLPPLSGATLPTPEAPGCTLAAIGSPKWRFLVPSRRGRSRHWGAVYGRRSEDLSWHRAHLETSLALVEAVGGRAVLDAGGGDSTLAEDLLARGYRRVHVVDIAAPALERMTARAARLGGAAAGLSVQCGDITVIELPAAAFDVWHDRALFHFLRTPEQRQAYVGQMIHALRPGGHAVLGVFAVDGPTRCSGLDVERYDAATLSGALGGSFELIESIAEVHHTPAGAKQSFQYCRFRRKP